jgi:outer membrane lipoprotein-sorting protein
MKMKLFDTVLFGYAIILPKQKLKSNPHTHQQKRFAFGESFMNSVSCKQFAQNYLAKALTLVLATGILLTSQISSHADIKSETLAALRQHYTNVPTMKGEFLQFGPTGDQSGGDFSIKRPGKVRFDYEDPSPVEVVSNGLAVMVINKKLKTFDTYPLKNTPLKLLLDDKLDISEESIIDVQVTDDVTTIVMGDKQIFGNSVITLLFEPNTFALRQWTIKDAQGKETSVMVFNVEDNVNISDREFQINKSKLKRSN